MIGYYYYLTKIRPYFTQTEKTDYTLIIFSLLTVLVFGFFGIRPLATATLKAYRPLPEGERYQQHQPQRQRGDDGRWLRLQPAAPGFD